MSKHTPGPWILKVERGTGGSITYAIHDQDGYEIHWFNDSGAKPQVQEREKKIAHLIAAAPDMYQALTQLIKISIKIAPDYLLKREDYQVSLAEAMASIAKAERQDD